MKALAVKYRPTSWSDVTEQDSVCKILNNQISTKTIRNGYLFCGGAGTGKTTCARIFAKQINNGKGEPIELDAASNNSVEDVRKVIEQAQTQSLDSEYKVFILDECVTGDTEILTNHGFKRFDSLDKTELIAQYTDSGSIEFVKPYDYVEKQYNGMLYVWEMRRGKKVRMTPHHVQPLYYSGSKTIKEKYIKDVNFNQTNSLIVGGHGIGHKCNLTWLDRVAILSQADGSIKYVKDDITKWDIGFTKQRKIDRFLMIMQNAGIQYTEIHDGRGNSNYRRFTYFLPSNITKNLSDYFNIVDFEYSCAREFIDEVKNWDGYVGPKNQYIYYSSKIKDNVDFVSAVATLGGYSSKVEHATDNRSKNYSDIYSTMIYDTEYRNCEAIKKTVTTEYFNGTVYCVKVPSHKIVIRSDGFTFITGNCHSLSNQGWQAMLKTLEEPPAKSVFIFCTTNPERIPNTILSRVQRFNFQRISQSGIIKRLKYILDEEINSGRNITYELPAVELIAKIADGGLRDAITLTDKCLSYSTELTTDTVVKALGIADYDVMIRLTNAVLSNKVKDVIDILNGVHKTGIDLKQFIKNYFEYILDVNILHITHDPDDTKLPDNVAKLELNKKFNVSLSQDYSALLNFLVDLQPKIKWEQNAKAVSIAEFMVFMDNYFKGSNNK